MSNKPRNVLLFSREAGGAEALAPVVKELSKHFHAVVLAKDYALERFKYHGIKAISLAGRSEQQIEREMTARGYDRTWGILTSATSLPKNDMTERYLWQWARKRKILSLAVVDQWQNYAMRFSGPKAGQRLQYLPDRIAVMNELAKKGCLEDGIPADKLVITGQPAFDELMKGNNRLKRSEIERVRRTCGLKPGELMVTFIAENLKRDKNLDYGYDEETILTKLIRQLLKLVELTGKKVRLVVKLHPQNVPEDFKNIKLDEGRGLTVVYVKSEVKPRPLVRASDYVIGMASVLIVESILLNQPTLSFQDNAKRRDLCFATEVGAIPLITDEEELFRVLKGLIMDKAFKKRYLAGQAKLRLRGGAAQKVARQFRRLVERSGSHG